MPAFGLGWDPAQATRARARMFAGRVYCTVGEPIKEPRPAVSLSHLRTRSLVQGRAGTCWAHSPVQLFEVTAKSLGYTPFPASVRAIGYAAKQKYEGGGNMADGGSPTDAVTVMTRQGVGIPHDALCPYTDDERTLAQPPPQSVYEDAGHTHLVAPVHVRTLDEVIRLIDAGKPVANGFMCPEELQGPGTFLDRLGGSMLGGHSILIWGYALPGVFDEHRWLEMENWWGPIYQPLPAAVASKVPGYEPYQPARSTSKWIRDDVYIKLCNMQGGAEHVSATDLDGLTKGLVEPASDPTDWFPV
jgi:hypothetical protein